MNRLKGNRAGFTPYHESGPRGTGFTLVELVMAIVILSFGLAAVLTLFSSSGKERAQVEFLIRSAPLAHGLLEEVLSKRFDEKLEETGGSGWSVLKNDSGESTRAEYDDVDDFDGFSESLSGPYAGTSRSVAVSYAQTTGGQVAATSDRRNPYKLITVTVTGAGGENLQVRGLATTLNSQGAPHEQ